MGFHKKKLKNFVTEKKIFSDLDFFFISDTFQMIQRKKKFRIKFGKRFAENLLLRIIFLFSIKCS